MPILVAQLPPILLPCPPLRTPALSWDPRGLPADAVGPPPGPSSRSPPVLQATVGSAALTIPGRLREGPNTTPTTSVTVTGRAASHQPPRSEACTSCPKTPSRLRARLLNAQPSPWGDNEGAKTSSRQPFSVEFLFTDSLLPGQG